MQYISLPPILDGVGVKYVVNEKFFDSWSSPMAYTLGYLFADGSLENASYLRGKYVRVSSTDRDRIETIKRLLSSEHSVVEEKAKKNRKERFVLRIGSHVLFDALIRLGVTERKSLTMKFPSVPQNFFSDFVRGYFDGDGCVYFERGSGATGKIVKRLSTIFTSGSKEFLSTLMHRLRKYSGVSVRDIYHYRENEFQLRYSTEDSLKIFSLIYSGSISKRLYLRRKYDIFKRYFKARPERVSDELKSVLARVR